MGIDKGLLKLDGKTFLGRVVSTLKELFDSVAVISPAASCHLPYGYTMRLILARRKGGIILNSSAKFVLLQWGRRIAASCVNPGREFKT